MSLSKRFQIVLKDQGLSQKRFCEITGYNQQTFSRFVSGTIANPGSNLLLLTAEHFPHVSTEWLLSGRGEMYKRGFNSTGEKVAQSISVSNQGKYLWWSGKGSRSGYCFIKDLSTLDLTKVLSLIHI